MVVPGYKLTQSTEMACPLWLVEFIFSLLFLLDLFDEIASFCSGLFFVPLRTASDDPPTLTSPLTTAVALTIPSSYLPYRVNSRGCCLRSRCCHKVLISADI